MLHDTPKREQNQQLPAKFKKNFQIQGLGTIPKYKISASPGKAETLIFPVCTGTGFACYSLKSHIQSLLALLFLKKAGAHFLKEGVKFSEKCVR